MNEIRAIEATQMKSELDSFKVGDTVKVHFKIVEGKTERIQIYEGLVIAIKNSRAGKTFIVRKNSYGVGVERVFPLHSPRIAKIEVVRPGKVRRAKLYYIRGKIGKAAKIKELIVSRKEKERSALAAAAKKSAALAAVEETAAPLAVQETAVNEPAAQVTVQEAAAQETLSQETAVQAADGSPEKA